MPIVAPAGAVLALVVAFVVAILVAIAVSVLFTPRLIEADLQLRKDEAEVQPGAPPRIAIRVAAGSVVGIVVGIALPTVTPIEMSTVAVTPLARVGVVVGLIATDRHMRSIAISIPIAIPIAMVARCRTRDE